MKKAIDGAESLLEARNLLAWLTPLNRDCGMICGRACCQADEDGLGGMLLYPGEEAFYRCLPEGFQVQPDNSVADGAFLLICGGSCSREDRPLACRIFPLAFTVTESGAGVSLDPRAWPICPLMPSGMEGMSESFVLYARQAAMLLWKNPGIQAFIKEQQAYTARCTEAPWEEGIL